MRGSSLTFHWLENPRPTTGRKALSLRERSTFGSGMVMSWLDEVDQVDFGIFLDIKLVEDYMRNYDEETQDEFLRRCKSCMEKKRGSLQ